MNSINAAILTIATSATGQSKPAASSKSSTTGVKSVDEQKSETEANEKEKAKAETENKNNEETSTQSKLGSQQIIASNLKALTPKPETNSKANTNETWTEEAKAKTPSTSDRDSILKSFADSTNNTTAKSNFNSANQMPNDKEIQAQMRNDVETIANNYDKLSTVEQAGLGSSSSQQSQSSSGQGMGGGLGGNSSGSYFNNVVVGNNSGNVIGDTSSLTGGGSIVEGGSSSAPPRSPEPSSPDIPSLEQSPEG